MPATRYGLSPWIDAVPQKKRPSHPPFKGEAEAPLVVIGGGLTGAMTAYAAAAAGIKVMLLEAGRLGQAGSGHASGICAGEAASSFLEMQHAAGRRVARTQFEAIRRAVLDLASTARRLSLKGDVEVTGAVRLVPPGGAASALRKDVEARREAGLEASWLKPEAVAKRVASESEGGARLSSWATCDPYRLTLAFAAAADRRGARLYESTAVRRITFDRVRATVMTASGAIVTPLVVHATGEPTALVPGLKRHFRPVAHWLALTDGLPAAIRKSLGRGDYVLSDTAAPPHLVRRTDDHRILVTGAEGPRVPSVTLPKLTVAHTGQLMYELSRLYPDISGLMPAYGWSLPIAHGVDHGLFVGPHRNFPHQLFAFGTAHDPARAFLASRILLRHVQGTPNGDDQHFGFARAL